jgi:hypothetical protein
VPLAFLKDPLERRNYINEPTKYLKTKDFQFYDTRNEATASLGEQSF